MKLNKQITLALLFSLCISVQAIAQKSKSSKKPKRVIFLIGDGMGLTQISAAMSQYKGQNAFMRFPVIGLSKTSSAKHYITDSGAGATAFSIGKKTYNYAIGVDADSMPRPTLFELAKIKNFATGVVVTSSIQHATPASFYAHVPNRKMYDSISTFLLNQNCDIAIGGGSDFIYKRADKRDLASELTAKGFTLINDTILKPFHTPKVIYTLAPDGLKTMQQGRGDYLKQASLLALTKLKKSKSYFLMIEGSQIDWGGHANDYTYMANELWDFNEVINAVLDLAANDDELLIVVTADHETGGLTLNSTDNPLSFKPKYSTGDHTGVMVPVFAFGAGAEEFAGIYENYEIYTKLVKLLKLK